MPATGSIRDLKINEVTYNVGSEAEATVQAEAEVSRTRTSGGAITNVEFQNPNVEGIEVDCSDPVVYDRLQALANSGAEVSTSFTWAGAQVWSSDACSINVGELSTKTGLCEVQLLPRGQWLKS